MSPDCMPSSAIGYRRVVGRRSASLISNLMGNIKAPGLTAGKVRNLSLISTLTYASSSDLWRGISAFSIRARHVVITLGADFNLSGACTEGEQRFAPRRLNAGAPQELSDATT